MQTQFLLHHSHIPLKTNKYPLIHCKKPCWSLASPKFNTSHWRPNLHCYTETRKKVVKAIIDASQDGSDVSLLKEHKEEEEVNVKVKSEGLESQSILKQMKDIIMFTGPATGLWICGPLMSLMDTAVIGQGSSIELAALGPGTVMCDNLSYIFMFLSIATSNLVATSLAKKDKTEVQHQLSILLFIGLSCGFLMLFLIKLFGSSVLAAFIGQNNLHIVPAANKYVQIRSLAWPAILVGWVAQSASLGMKDSWGPLKALAAASAVNGIGAVVLCRYLNSGLEGAAWAAMASQVLAAFMMVNSLNNRGYNAYAISVPSLSDLMTIFGIAAPVFVMMISKVAFYSLLVYFATSMGLHAMAAHQILIEAFLLCTVWGEPLSQTAQSFLPELLFGVNRSLEKARMLLKSLAIIGTILGLILGIMGTSVPWLFPNFFTPDRMVISEMHKALLPFFLALAVTPCTLSLEGTLLAGRDLKFVGLSMSGCFTLGALALMLVSTRGYGLQGCWYALVGFQWARFLLALQRLLSPNGILFSEDNRFELKRLKVT